MYFKVNIVSSWISTSEVGAWRFVLKLTKQFRHFANFAPETIMTGE